MITDKNFKEWKPSSVESGTWLIGEPHDGAGVYPENDIWTGNVVCGMFIEGIGNYNTLQEAKDAAQKRWLEYRASLGFEPIEEGIS